MKADRHRQRNRPSHHQQRVVEFGRMPLDNKAAFRYLNPSCRHHNEIWGWVTRPSTYLDSAGYRTLPKNQPYIDPQKGILVF